MEEHSPDTEIVELSLFVYDKAGVKERLKSFFTKNTDIFHGVSFNSSIHTIANFLKKEMPGHHHVTLLGYDAIDANVTCIKDGSVDFLIAQHPMRQGLNCIRTMINACVLHYKQNRNHYMAIDLLTKENIDFYKD
jgi:LacI family transcriptional regulator